MVRKNWRVDQTPLKKKASASAVARVDGGPDSIPVSEWVRQKLGIEPDEAQSRVLDTQTRRGILNCTRQWGKSTIGAAKAAHVALSAPGKMVIVASPTRRQSGELVKKASGFLERLGIKPKGDGANEISLALPNGSRIVGLPGKEGTIRGFSAVSLALIDEASRVDDDVYMAIRPMLAVSKGSIWLMSTPWGKRGFFWEAWDSDAEWERVKVPASECPRIPREFLEEERATMVPGWFEQEYCCEFNESERGIFTREMIAKAMTNKVKPLDI